MPEYLNWDLWRGPLTTALPYSEDLAPRRWRAFWETGGGQLADWGCHLLDLLYFAYDLPSPEAVLTHTPRAAQHRPLGAQPEHPHLSGRRQVRPREVRRALQRRLPCCRPLPRSDLPPVKAGANHTMVVCEEGTLLLQADGKITIFRKGKVVDG